MSIKNFMPDKQKEVEIYEFVQTEVFDEAIKIRLLDQKESENIMSTCTIKDKRGQLKGFDQNKYMKLIAVAAIAEPNLKAKDLQDAYGVMGEVELFDKLFPKYRDAQRVINAAHELNSSEELDELIEEAKN